MLGEFVILLLSWSGRMLELENSRGTIVAGIEGGIVVQRRIFRSCDDATLSEPRMDAEGNNENIGKAAPSHRLSS